jgi:hypothetical protein
VKSLSLTRMCVRLVFCGRAMECGSGLHVHSIVS